MKNNFNATLAKNTQKKIKLNTYSAQLIKNNDN
jgi:hypothetical protein